MLSFLKGTIEEKRAEEVVLNVNGIGFSICITPSTYERLPEKGEVKLYIVETQAPFSGGITLYGFLTEEERDLFCFFREEMKGVAGKRALDYVEKAARSLISFKNAISKKSPELLTSMFGFRKKTAEKIILSLHEKLKIQEVKKISDELYSTALGALRSLGFKESQAKAALEEAISSLPPDTPIEILIKTALKHIQPV
jgi:Holliday junction DNA helicase RuvA